MKLTKSTSSASIGEENQSMDSDVQSLDGGISGDDSSFSERKSTDKYDKKDKINGDTQLKVIVEDDEDESISSLSSVSFVSETETSSVFSEGSSIISESGSMFSDGSSLISGTSSSLSEKDLSPSLSRKRLSKFSRRKGKQTDDSLYRSNSPYKTSDLYKTGGSRRQNLKQSLSKVSPGTSTTSTSSFLPEDEDFNEIDKIISDPISKLKLKADLSQIKVQSSRDLSLLKQHKPKDSTKKKQISDEVDTAIKDSSTKETRDRKKVSREKLSGEIINGTEKIKKSISGIKISRDKSSKEIDEHKVKSSSYHTGTQRVRKRRKEIISKTSSEEEESFRLKINFVIDLIVNEFGENCVEENKFFPVETDKIKVIHKKDKIIVWNIFHYYFITYNSGQIVLYQNINEDQNRLRVLKMHPAVHLIYSIFNKKKVQEITIDDIISCFSN